MPDTYQEPLIDVEQLEAIVKDCLYNDDEIGDPATENVQLPLSAVMVQGILHTYGFHPERLESHREEVTKMLQSLPLAFRPASVEVDGVQGGGGWSFLNACQDANDVQWTGMHLMMEQLFALGIGLGIAAWLMPREMWSAFPGGMPYVVVKV